MVKFLQAVFLGIVQGFTEFLPVSSSAHLNIFPWLFHWESAESYDLALHIGTLLAILVYFFKDWIALIVGGFNTVVKKERSANGRLFWYLVIATVPAGLLGKLMEHFVDKALEGNLNGQMIVISIALIVMGVLLYLADSRCKTKFSLQKMPFKQGFLIGLSQALAGAIPGVSRSGVTMTAARCFGLDREGAARYSFLLSAPMVAGAALMSIGEFGENMTAVGGLAAFLGGIIASFITGFLVIHFFMKFLKKGSLKGFAIYRVAFGLLIIVIALVR